MVENHAHTIVVGFDGSKGSVAALEWAAKEAGLRHEKLCIIRAWSPGEFASEDDLATYNETKLAAEVRDILGSDPEIEWDGQAIMGSPGKVLIEHGSDADMIVVGSRGHGGFAGLLLGSVSHQVSTHAGSPVVVIVHAQ